MSPEASNRKTSSDLDQLALTSLKGVGPSLAEKFAGIHIHTVLDLLFHLPLRYMDRTRISPIGGLQANTDVVIEGSIVASDLVFGRRRSLMVKVQDGTGTISLRFFHFSAAQKNTLTRGKVIRCFGEARWGKGGLEMYHPEYRIFSEDKVPALELTLTPVYPTTEGLQQVRIRKLIQQAIALLGNTAYLPDFLPAALSQSLGFVSLADALRYIHNPPRDASLTELQSGSHASQSRLVFEELLANYLGLRQLRHQAQQVPAPELPPSPELLNEFIKGLPFDLTRAQLKVAAEISKDLSTPVPMLRLVQGDVGSGKTLVAIIAALQAVSSSYQVAIMAPTEILAEQHMLNFSILLEKYGLRLAYLSSKIKGKKRQETLEEIKQGNTDIVIGTHALFQEEVEFNRLGLLVVDEQHRFGVHQRLQLREKGYHDGRYPHQLIMTATPIPRTLTMSAYADLDCSIIDELPPGRTPVNTLLISDQRRNEVIERIRNACEQGKQVYWVCTLIEESETLQCQAAEACFKQLKEALATVNVNMIHGRMKPAEKTRVMNIFKNGDCQLLVATTVIEVGVDVPNASLMIIENPERLGLAQLHQLRGRVGRGSQLSHCLLLYHQPLSEHGRQRLEIMRSSNDGFFIAEKDLELRGPGEVLGTRQTGLMNYRIADLARDAYLLPQIKSWADKIEKQHPELVPRLINRWLAGNKNYGNV